MSDLPEEAVEAVLSREGRKNGYMTPEFVRADLEAAAPAIREQAVEEERQRRIEAGREKVAVRDTDWVAEQPMEGWVTEDDHLNEVDAAVEEQIKQERERLLSEMQTERAQEAFREAFVQTPVWSLGDPEEDRPLSVGFRAALATLKDSDA